MFYNSLQTIYKNVHQHTITYMKNKQITNSPNIQEYNNLQILYNPFTYKKRIIYKQLLLPLLLPQLPGLLLRLNLLLLLLGVVVVVVVVVVVAFGGP